MFLCLRHLIGFEIFIGAEEEEGDKAQRRVEPLLAAQRGDGVLGTHMHGGLRDRQSIRE